MHLSDMVGDQILIRTAIFGDPNKLHKVKLLGVEAGGIWIESQEFLNVALQIGGVASTENIPVIFVPYHQIYFVLSSVRGLALDEKAFGL
jgi:hypothetical protein